MKIKIINTHGVSDFDSMRKVWDANKPKLRKNADGVKVPVLDVNGNPIIGDHTYLTVCKNSTEEWNDWIDFYGDVNNWAFYEKKLKIPMIITGEVAIDGGQKTDENIVSRSALIFDFDQITASRDEVIERFKEYEFFLYASSSNGIKPGLNCRVIIPFGYDVSSDEWKKRNGALRKLFPADGAIGVDPSCFRIAQGQCIPAKIIGTQAFAYHNKGKLFDFMALPVDVVSTKPVSAPIAPLVFAHAQSGVERVLEALVSNNAGSLGRSELWNVGQVLKVIGYADPSIIMALRHSDAKTEIANAFSGIPSTHHNISFLKKFMPKGFVWPDFEAEALAEVIKLKTNIVQNTRHISPKVDYDVVFDLEEGEYLDDIRDELLKALGKVTILDAVCGVGKSYLVSILAKMGIAVFASPLRIILKQNVKSESDSVFNSIENGTMTWQKVITMTETEDCSKLILFIDEAHGLYLDAFKADCVGQLLKAFACFGKVVLMSGTIRKEYFSGLEVDTVIRVNKPQAFSKVYNRIAVNSEKTDASVLSTAFFENFKNDGKPFLIYNNNIVVNQVIDNVLTSWGKKSLHINASPDYTKLPEFVNFTKADSKSLLSEIQVDGVIGTNSVVEGVNINDVCDEANVYIIGECSPERIEQVTNRFRKCTGTIHVYHILHSPMAIGIGKFDVKRMVEIAKAKVTLENEEFELYDESTIRMKLNTWDYSNSMFFDFNKSTWKVNYIHIDNMYSDFRKSIASNYYRECMNTLMEYGFDEGKRSTKEVDSRVVRDMIEIIKEENENTRVEKMTELKDQIGDIVKLGKFVNDNASLKQNEVDVKVLTARSVQKMVDAGMPSEQINVYMDMVIKSKDGWQAAYRDRKDATEGNEITRFIIGRIKVISKVKNGKRYIGVEDARNLARDVILFCFDNVYRGVMPVEECVSLFGNKFTLDNGEIKLSGKTQTAREIINSFIHLSTLNKNTKMYEVLHWNRTGLHFNGTDNNVLLAKDRTLRSTDDIDHMREILFVDAQYRKLQTTQKIQMGRIRSKVKKEKKELALAAFGQ